MRLGKKRPRKHEAGQRAVDSNDRSVPSIDEFQFAVTTGRRLHCLLRRLDEGRGGLALGKRRDEASAE